MDFGWFDLDLLIVGGGWVLSLLFAICWLAERVRANTFKASFDKLSDNQSKTVNKAIDAQAPRIQGTPWKKQAQTMQSPKLRLATSNGKPVGSNVIRHNFRKPNKGPNNSGPNGAA